MPTAEGAEPAPTPEARALAAACAGDAEALSGALAAAADLPARSLALAAALADVDAVRARLAAGDPLDAGPRPALSACCAGRLARADDGTPRPDVDGPARLAVLRAPGLAGRDALDLACSRGHAAIVARLEAHRGAP